MATQMKVGFIGLGKLGLPMARRVLQAGYPLTVYDIRPEPMNDLVVEGARGAESAREVARASEVVLTSLPSLQACEEVYLGPQGLLTGAQRGSVLVETSTVPPRLVKTFAAAAEKQGIVVIDAAVSGGKPGQGVGAPYRAAEGALTVMVGGDDEVVARVRPILSTFGNPVLHIGPLGTGALTKVVNNSMGMANFLAAAESIGAAVALGADLKAMHQAIKDSSGSSVMFDFMMDGYFRTGTLGTMATNLAIKDSEAIIEVGMEAGTPMFLQGAKLAWYQMARRKGFGDRSWGEAIMALWEEMLGTHLRYAD